MAEKRVSVRLGAEGGSGVRAEFKGVGQAGEDAFGDVSRSAEQTNRDLADFARKAKVAAAVIATAVVAAAGAMIRSGLETVDAQAKLAASLGTTVESIQILERAGDLAGVSMGQVEQATIQLTRRLSQAASGAGPAVDALKRLKLSGEDLQALPLDERIAAIQNALEQFVPEAERASVASELFGDRAGLIFSRIDSATLRTATQDVRDFGVAVSQEDAAQIERTNDAISRLGLVWRGFANQLTVAVAPALEGIANGLAALARAAGPIGSSLNVVLDNLDRLGAYATVAAAALTIYMVPAAIAATLAVGRMTAALLASRVALARTGYGLAILALGELAYRSGMFSSAADESTSAQDRMNDALAVFAGDSGPAARAEAVAATQDYIALTKAQLESADATLQDVRAKQEQAAALLEGNRLTAGGNSGYAEDIATRVAEATQSVVALEAKLVDARARLIDLENADPAAPINVAVRASNQLTAGLGNAVTRARQLVTALGQAPMALRSLQDQAAVLDAGLAAAARGADQAAISSAQYRAELEQTYGLAEAGSSLEDAYISAVINRQVAEFDANEDRKRALDDYIGQLGKVETAAGSAGRAAETAAELAAQAAAAGSASSERTAASLANYARDAMDMQKGLNDTMVNGFRGAEGVVRQFVTTGKADFKSLVTSMLADLAVLVARRTILGPLANALSGAFGGATTGVPIKWFHSGGNVGNGGRSGMANPLAFVGAPRFHQGMDLNLKPDEVPAILQRGERVWSREDVRRGKDRAGSSQQVTVVVELRDDMLDARISEGAGRVVVQRAPEIVRESVGAVRAVSSESRRFFGQ